jgi:hypothetical protein
MHPSYSAKGFAAFHHCIRCSDKRQAAPGTHPVVNSIIPVHPDAPLNPGQVNYTDAQYKAMAADYEAARTIAEQVAVRAKTGFASNW